MHIKNWFRGNLLLYPGVTTPGIHCSYIRSTTHHNSVRLGMHADSGIEGGTSVLSDCQLFPQAVK